MTTARTPTRRRMKAVHRMERAARALELVDRPGDLDEVLACPLCLLRIRARHLYRLPEDGALVCARCAFLWLASVRDADLGKASPWDA